MFQSPEERDFPWLKIFLGLFGHLRTFLVNKKKKFLTFSTLKVGYLWMQIIE
jgi:hypothetical protein